MKIAFIGQKGIPAGPGEIEKNVEKLAANFAERGHQVFVYARNNYTHGSIAKYKGINVINLPAVPFKNLGTLSHSFFAVIHSLFCDYDIIHFQSLVPTSLSFIPKILKRKTSIISTLYSPNYRKRNWLVKKYMKFSRWISCRVPEKTIVKSKKLRSFLHYRYGKKTAYIPSGAEVEYNSETKVLDRWNLKDKKYILSIGCGHKDSKNLIEAFKNLEDRTKFPNNFKLVIIENLLQDEDLSYLHKEGTGRENIIFTRNHTRASLEQLFSHAYLFIQPSDPGSGIALLEAMGYGVTPFVGNISENLEIIGKCGFSFRTGDKEDMEEKMAYLLNRPAEIQRMEKLAKERAQRDFSWDSMSKKILSIYENCLSQKLSRGRLLKKLQVQNKFYA